MNRAIQNPTTDAERIATLEAQVAQLRKWQEIALVVLEQDLEMYPASTAIRQLIVLGRKKPVSARTR